MTAFNWTLELSDTVTTIDFTVSPYELTDWTPSAGAVGEATVTGQLTVRLLQGVLTALTNVRTIERLLRQARRYQETGLGNAVYLRFKEDTAADQYRSEILAGIVEFDRRVLGTHWRSDVLLLTLLYTRRNYWEGPEAEVPLVNGNGSGMGGRKVFNYGDATGVSPNVKHNHVQIAAADVTGDLPANCRIELINNTIAPRNRHHYVAHAILPDPANLTHILEGEDSTGGTDFVDANASGGDYTRFALGAAETDELTWALSTALLDALGDNWYKILCRFHNLPSSSSEIRLKLMYQSTEFWRQDSMLTLGTSDFLQDLGNLRIEPTFLAARATRSTW